MATILTEQKATPNVPQQRDPLTSALRNINCKENADYLLTQFHGKDVVLYFIDVNGMGPTDKCGGEISKNVDRYISKLVEIAARTFTNVEVVRYGGDEFGIIVEYQEGKTEKEAASFTSQMEKLRAEMFPATDSKIIAAQKFANHRALLRKKADEQIIKLNETFFSLKGNETFSEITNKLTQKADNLIREAVTERNAYRVISNQTEKFTVFPIMSLQIAPSYVFKITDPELLSEQLHLAYAVASRNASREKKNTSYENRIVAYKEKNFIPVEPPLADMPKMRSAELLEVENARKLSEEVRRLKFEGADPKTVRRLELQDANLSTAVIRAEMLDGVLLGDLLPSIDTHMLHAAKISIPSFGLYNSVYGYERANALFDHVTATVLETFPAALLIRQGGGDVGILSLTSVSEEQLKRLTSEVSSQFHQDLIGELPPKIGNIRAYFELLLQAKIKELYSASNAKENEFNPGEVKVVSRLKFPLATATKELKNYLL